MNKFLKISLIVFTLFISQTSFAQMFQFGIAYNGLYFKGQTLSSFDPGSNSGTVYSMNELDDKNHLLGMSFFYYQSLYEVNPELSLGLQVGGTISGNYQKAGNYRDSDGVVSSVQGSPFIFTSKIPITAMIRGGALATEDSEAIMGGAVGFGIMPVSFIHPLQNGTFLPLILTTELNYQNVGLRIDIPLSKFTSHYTTTTGDLPKLTMDLYSINLTFGFH